MRKSKKWKNKELKFNKKERATLRHRNKNKYTFLLNRFADKNETQTAYASLGNERRSAINKLKELHQNLEENESSYDENVK